MNDRERLEHIEEVIRDAYRARNSEDQRARDEAAEAIPDLEEARDALVRRIEAAEILGPNVTIVACMTARPGRVDARLLVVALIHALALALALAMFTGAVAPDPYAAQVEAENAYRGGLTFCEAHPEVPHCNGGTP